MPLYLELLQLVIVLLRGNMLAEEHEFAPLPPSQAAAGDGAGSVGALPPAVLETESAAAPLPPALETETEEGGGGDGGGSSETEEEEDTNVYENIFPKDKLQNGLAQAKLLWGWGVAKASEKAAAVNADPRVQAAKQRAKAKMEALRQSEAYGKASAYAAQAHERAKPGLEAMSAGASDLMARGEAAITGLSKKATAAMARRDAADVDATFDPAAAAAASGGEGGGTDEGGSAALLNATVFDPNEQSQLDEHMDNEGSVPMAV